MCIRTTRVAVLLIFFSLSIQSYADDESSNELQKRIEILKKLDQKDFFGLEADIYKILGNVSGDTSLTDNIQIPGIQEPFMAKQEDMTFFTTARLNCGGVQLEANENSWTWDGMDILPATGAVNLLVEPNLGMVVPYQGVHFEFMPEESLEYFIKRGSLYKLKKSDEKVGLSFSFDTEYGTENRITLKNLSFVFRSVVSREPLDGVQLDVGKPIIRESVHQVDVSLKSGTYYGIMLIVDGQGVLLIRLRCIWSKVSQEYLEDELRRFQEYEKRTGKKITPAP